MDSSATTGLFGGLEEGIREAAKPKRSLAAKKPRPKSKAELTKELAQKLIAALRSHRAANRPKLLTLRELALSQGDVKEAELKTAIGNKLFKAEAILPKSPSKTFSFSKAMELPVALCEDIDRLAGDERVLLAAIGGKRKEKNHAFSVSELKAWLSGKALKGSFSKIVSQQVNLGTLPDGVGWISIRVPKLFLVEDLHLPQGTARQTAGESVKEVRPGQSGPAAVQPRAGVAAADFPARFDEAFARIDRRNGSYNFVWLSDLREALSEFSKEEFDLGLKLLRQTRRFRLNVSEGRAGLSQEQQAAAIIEDGLAHTSVSRIRS